MPRRLKRIAQRVIRHPHPHSQPKETLPSLLKMMAGTLIIIKMDQVSRKSSTAVYLFPFLKLPKLLPNGILTRSHIRTCHISNPGKALALHIRKKAVIRELLPKLDQFDKIGGVQEFARAGLSQLLSRAWDRSCRQMVSR